MRRTYIDAWNRHEVEVRDGKLAHERLYWDRANTLRQLGRFAAIVAVALRPPVPEASLLTTVEKR